MCDLLILFAIGGSALAIAGKTSGVLYQGDRYDKALQTDIVDNKVRFTGSFCTTVQGSYTLRMIGRQSLYAEKFGNEDTSDWEEPAKGRCVDSNYVKDKTFQLNGHSCYPFSFFMGYWCAFQRSHLEIQVKGPNDGQFQHLGNANSITDASYFDCLDNWYGSDCSRDGSSTFCNNHGRLNDKKNGDGFCICDSGYSGPFCEPPNQKYFSTNPMIDEFTPDFGNYKEDSKFQMRENPLNMDNLSYSGVKISGKIMIPQTGSYSFRVISTSKPVLNIANKKVGQLGNQFDCEVDTINNYYSGDINSNLNRGAIPFEIRINQGCGMVKNSVEFQWKNYRQHRDSSATPWETIPIRYLGFQ